MVGDKSDMGFDMGYKWRLVIKYGNEIGIHDEYLFGWLNMICMWLGHNSLNLYVRFQGGALVGRDVIPW